MACVTATTTEEHPVEFLVMNLVNDLLNNDEEPKFKEISQTNLKHEALKNIRIQPIFLNQRSSSCSSIIDLEVNMKKRAMFSPPIDLPAKRKPVSPLTTTKEQSPQRDGNCSDYERQESSFTVSDDNKAKELQIALDQTMRKRANLTADKWPNCDQLEDLDSSFRTLGSDFEQPPSVSKELAHLAVIRAIQEAVDKAISPILSQMITQNMVQKAIETAISPVLSKLDMLTITSSQQSEKIPIDSKAKKQFSRSEVTNNSLLSPSYPELPLTITIPPISKNKTNNYTSYSHCAGSDINQVPTLGSTMVSQSQTPKQIRTNSNPAYDLSRKCQGFHPITSVDIEKIGEKYADIQNEEERFQQTGKDCIRNFLFDEMNISERIIGNLRIKSIFFPPMGAGSATLFAEFYDEDEVNLIKGYSRNLRSTDKYKAKLVLYVPRSLQDRLKAVEKEAFKIRRDSGKTMMTRIWISSEIELRAKKKDDPTSWASISPISLTNLPDQAPKKPWKQLDVLDYRTPETPFFQTTHAQMIENNHFHLLSDDCQD